MEYSLKGQLSYKKGWEPYISVVHIGQTRQYIDNELMFFIFRL